MYRSVDWRVILSKALSGHSEAGRLYTIRWLGVLARMGFPSFSQFGIELLVEQLKDNSLQVSFYFVPHLHILVKKKILEGSS